MSPDENLGIEAMLSDELLRERQQTLRLYGLYLAEQRERKLRVGSAVIVALCGIVAAWAGRLLWMALRAGR